MIKQVLLKYKKNFPFALLLNCIIIPSSVVFYYRYVSTMEFELFRWILGISLLIFCIIHLYNLLEFLIVPIIEVIEERAKEILRQSILNDKKNAYKIGTYVRCREHSWSRPYRNQIAKIIDVFLDNQDNTKIRIQFINKHINEEYLNYGGGRYPELSPDKKTFDFLPEDVLEKNYEDWNE